MLENAFKIAIDPLFPEPHHATKKMQNASLQEYLPKNKFELIFHEKYDGPKLRERMGLLGTADSFTEMPNQQTN